MKTYLPLVACILALTSFIERAQAVSVTVQFQDAAGFGFNETTPATPVGGNSGTTLGDQRKIALQYAISRWSANISGTKSIGVKVRSVNPGRRDGSGNLNFLATASPLKFAGNWTTGTVPAYSGTLYPSSLADQLANFNFDSPNHGTWDIQINHNISYDGLVAGDSDTRVWYYGLDSNAPGTNFDFVGVMLHEVGHGLGFISNASQDGTWGALEQPNGSTAAAPTVWDQLIVDGSGNSLVGMSQANRDTAVEGNNLFVGGAILQLHNNNNRARLNAPVIWAGGSSMHHLDETTYPSPTKATTNINELMTPNASQPTQVFGPHVMDLMQDMGYTMADTQIPLPPSIEIPVAGRSMKSSPTPVVSGTAVDKSGAGDSGAAGLLWVKIALSRGTDFYNWTTNAFEGGGFIYGNHTKRSEVENIPISTGVRKWKLTLPAGLAEGGYVLHASAIDMLNQGTDFVTTSFTIDNTAPNVQVVPYAESTTVFDLSDLRISAPGAVSGSLKIHYTNGGITYYWAGNSWISTDTSFPLTEESDGIFLPTNVPGRGSMPAPGQLFHVSATVVDAASNSSAGTRALYRSAADTTPPVLTFATPTQGEVITTNYLNGIQGTVQDAESGIASASLTWTRFIPGGDLEFWNGASWGPTPVNLPVALSGGPLATDLKTWQAPAASWALPSGEMLRNGGHSVQITSTNRESPGNTSGLGRSFTVDFHQTYHWTAGSWSDLDPNNGDWYWGNPANWSPNGIPGSDDIAIIDLDHTVRSTISRTVHGFHMSTGALDFDNGSDSLTITKTGTWTGGTFFDTVFIEPAASFAMSGGGVKQIWAGGVINNSGATTWTGPGLLRGYQNSTWNNKPGSSFTMTGDGDVFSNYYAGNVFNNEADATFIKTGGDPGDASTYLDEWTVNNNGRIESQQGTLHFNTTLNLNAGSNLAGAGRVLFNGTTNLAVALPSTGHPELIGTLNATAPGSAFSGSHPLNWSSGWINGTFSLQGGSVMELTTGNVKYLGAGAVFTNHGRVNWKEGLFRGYQNSTFNNESGGVFDAFTDGDIFSNNYGGNVFNNAAGALFVKSGKSVTPGATSFVDEWTFNNSGAIRADDGVLQFNTGLYLFGGGTIGHAGGAAARVLSTHYFVLTGTTTVNNVTFETAGDWHGNLTEGTAGNGALATTGSGRFEWSGGTAHNIVSITANSDFRITGSAVKQINGGGVLQNYGHATWSGDGQLRGYQSSTFHNLAGATFTALTDADFHNNYGGNAFVNAAGATFEKTAGSDRIECNWAFNNAGTVLASSGALGMNSGGVSSGTFAPSTGGEIHFLGGQHDFITGANCTGTGIVRVNGGVVNAVNPVTSNFSAGLLEISAGAVTSAAAGAFGVSGHIDWTGGTIAGVFNISPGSDFSLDGGDVKWIGGAGVINNSGAATWNPPGLLRGYQAGTWNNKSGGSFTMTGDGDVFANNYSGNIFNNEAGAQFVKTTGAAGDASTYIDEWTFNNNGAVSSQQGTLHFNTTLNLDAGSTLAGAGRVLLNGTTNLTTLLASTGNPELVGSLNGNTPTAGYSGSQPFIWSSGGINGTFTLQNGSVLELTTGNVKQIGGSSVFNNFGRVNWKTGLLRGFQSSIFNNESGGIFDAFTDGDVFANYYSGNVFNNKAGALFVKSGKSGTPDDSTFIDEWTFNNSGVLRSDDGLLRFHTALMLDPGSSVTRGSALPARVLSSHYFVLTGATTVSNVTFESSGDWHGNLTIGTAGNGTIATQSGGVFEWTGGTAHNTVNIAPGSVFAISGSGVKQLGGGGILNNGGIATRTGSGELRGFQSSTFVNLPGAVFNVNSSAPFTNYYGGNRLTNSGVLNIGAGVGVLPLHWSFTQTGTGRLNLEIGGANPATPDFDQLNVSGDAVLAGSLGVSLINGYAPPADTAFPVLTFGSRGGSFGTLLSPGLVWGTQYNANNLTLIAKTYPTTLAEWRSYFFADPGSADAQSFADFDRDGISNLMEYALGRDPRAGGASGIAPGKVVIGSDTYLTLTFTRPAGAAALTDVNYGGERSGSLGGWSSSGVVVESVVPVPGQAKETVTLRSAQPVSGASKDFLRLKATVGN